MKIKVFLLSLILFLISIILPFWIAIPYFLDLIGKYLHISTFDNLLLKIIGAIFVALGLIGSSHTFFLFRKFGQGTPAPILPTKKLVIKSLYKYTRNPMYLSYMLTILGEFFLYGQWLIIVYLLVFFLLFNFYVIKFEEPNLKKKFGKEYIEYTKKVRRWL